MNHRGWLMLACAGMALAVSAHAAENRTGRRIEEVVVTAEKREATVSDTSISITALGQDMIEDFGLQGPDDLANFIPATTRDSYDIRIRGVGRNFRAIGGDPGVATYYNGVYSEDFGIASTENGLYDVERIEVLRGPQGTLYGRNAIGGAINYITNKPTYDWEGEVRALMGNYNTKEYYGIVSGPLIADRLAARIVGVKRDRDGSVQGDNGSQDIDSIDDRNVSVALNWHIADNWEANVRWNGRSSDRIIGDYVLIDTGPQGDRGAIDTGNFAYGIRPVAAGTPGALPFVHPVTGEVRYGAPIRPGLDLAASHRPNSYYGVTGQTLDNDIHNLDPHVATNNMNNEGFDQQAVQADLTWDLNDTTSLKYIGGWMDYDYTFDLDSDNTNGTLSEFRSTVLEATETYSHELQLLWQIGKNLQMTSGVYLFSSHRLQDFAFKDLASQGRYTQRSITETCFRSLRRSASTSVWGRHPCTEPRTGWAGAIRRRLLPVPQHRRYRRLCRLHPGHVLVQRAVGSDPGRTVGQGSQGRPRESHRIFRERPGHRVHQLRGQPGHRLRWRAACLLAASARGNGERLRPDGRGHQQYSDGQRNSDVQCRQPHPSHLRAHRQSGLRDPAQAHRYPLLVRRPDQGQPLVERRYLPGEPGLDAHCGYLGVRVGDHGLSGRRVLARHR